MMVREFNDYRLVVLHNDCMKMFRPSLLKLMPSDEGSYVETKNLGNAIEFVLPHVMKSSDTLFSLHSSLGMMMEKVEKNGENAVYALDAISSVTNNLLVILDMFKDNGISVCDYVIDRLTVMMSRCKGIRYAEDNDDLVNECKNSTTDLCDVAGYIHTTLLTKLTASVIDKIYRNDMSFYRAMNLLHFLSKAFDILVCRVMSL